MTSATPSQKHARRQCFTSFPKKFHIDLHGQTVHDRTIGMVALQWRLMHQSIHRVGKVLPLYEENVTWLHRENLSLVVNDVFIDTTIFQLPEVHVVVAHVECPLVAVVRDDRTADIVIL